MICVNAGSLPPRIQMSLRLDCGVATASEVVRRRTRKYTNHSHVVFRLKNFYLSLASSIRLAKLVKTERIKSPYQSLLGKTKLPSLTTGGNHKNKRTRYSLEALRQFLEQVVPYHESTTYHVAQPRVRLEMEETKWLPYRRYKNLAANPASEADY